MASTPTGNCPANAAWPYTGTRPRDPHLDSLRGLMLVIMTIAHSSSRLVTYVHYGLGFIGDAIGFVFLAGMSAGRTFGGPQPLPPEKARRRLVRRALILWLVHAGLAALLLTIYALYRQQLAGYWPWRHLLRDDLLIAWLKYASLVYQTTLFDILPMYVVCLLATPLALAAFHRHRTGWVIAISTVLWATAQIAPDFQLLLRSASLSWLALKPGQFNWLAWQLPYFLGLSFGYWHGRRPLPAFMHGRILLALVIAIALALLALGRAHAWAHSPITRAWLPDSLVLADALLHALLADRLWNGKTVVAPLYLLNFAVLTYLVWRLTRRWPQLLCWRWLALLGRNSLAVFGFHIVLVFALAPVGKTLRGTTWTTQSIYTAAVVASLTLPAWISDTVRRRRRERGAPAATPVTN